MGSALVRGRTLDKDAARKAKQWREKRVKYLQGRLQDGTITIKERRELRWKWGAF